MTGTADATGHADHPRGVVRAWRTGPLVVAAHVESPEDAGAARLALEADHPGTAFVAVLAVRSLGDLGGVLEGLAPVLAERVLSTAADGSTADASAAATAALEQHGVGQDFVFEVSPVARAVEYALGALAGHPAWEGTALLVAGPAAVLDEARVALAPDLPPTAT